jgi:MFS family permease
MVMISTSNGIGTDILVKQNKFFYGWIIVAACTLIMAVQWGIQYSFSIFFKPLATDFGWTRAATAGVYSVYMISAGASAIPLGWLADRFGPARIASISGLMMGLGLILASRITNLWQLYLTFGILNGIGAGGTFAICMGVVTRWFVKKRGFALGIVTAGIGLGTFLMSPLVERLIAVYGWSQSYLIIGIGSLIILVGSSFLLRRDPESVGLLPYGVESVSHLEHEKIATINHAQDNGASINDALRSGPLWMIMFLVFSFNVALQLVMVHLANYTTDQGFSPLAAAMIISVIGVGSSLGRIGMGAVSDRIGSTNSLIICCFGVTLGLVWLMFSKELWMLYVFAVFFSIAYGGEVPQMPLMVSRFFGLKSVIALVGITSATARLGGALGSWMGGKVFDMRHSYILAFIIAAGCGLLALLTALVLKRVKTPV